MFEEYSAPVTLSTGAMETLIQRGYRVPSGDHGHLRDLWGAGQPDRDRQHGRGCRSSAAACPARWKRHRHQDRGVATAGEQAAPVGNPTATHPAAANETFNITSGTARSLRDLTDIARSHFPNLRVVNCNSHDPVRRTRRGALDVSKARRMLGYEPRTMLDAGFARYVAFWREHELAGR